jgi:hypothetical protein
MMPIPERSRGQIVKWICYALLGLLCAVLQTTPGLFQFGASVASGRPSSGFTNIHPVNTRNERAAISTAPFDIALFMELAGECDCAGEDES